MSKKIRKKQTAFELEPDGFSIHTFELSRRLTGYEFNMIKKKLYDLQEALGEKKRVYKESKGIYRCSLFAKSGIRITLEQCEDAEYERQHLYVVVNPRQMIDSASGYLGIFPPGEKNLEELEKRFKRLFADTEIPNDMNDYLLRRLDLCVNIRCGKEKIFRELVRVLRKLPTPKKYERIFYKHEDKKKANNYNKHYLRFACGTHELVIYDKVYQMVENNIVKDYEELPTSVLRVEMHCEREYLRKIQKNEEIKTTVRLIGWMVQNSEDLIIQKFEHCFRTGIFCQIQEIENRIKASSFSKEKKDNMLELSHRMQRKQNLDKELKAMVREKQENKKLRKKRNLFDTDELLDAFRKIGINPVPLWQNFIAPCLPGPVELLQGVSCGKLPVEYLKVKG